MIRLSTSQLRALREIAAWLIGRRRRIRVAGDSMLPTLEAGQFVLVDRETMPDVTELAVAAHPTEQDVLVIKRVGEIHEDGTFYLVSDNADAGTDSRTWGPIPAESVVGSVTLLLDNPRASL